MSKGSTLVDRADQDACYESVAGEYSGALRRLVDAYEADPEQRRDLLQEIHVAIWRSLAAFQHQCSMRTWIYRVAHNTAMAHITRDRRRATERLYTLDEISDMVDPYDTEAITGRQLVAERLTALISRLQVLDRQIFLLYLEGMDATSIAAIAGMTPGNVATKVHRIKTLLVRQFHATETDHE